MWATSSWSSAAPVGGPATMSIWWLAATVRPCCARRTAPRGWSLVRPRSSTSGEQLAAAGFTELPEDLRSLPEEDEPQPDVVEYAITADGHTVRALGSALPAQLVPLVEALNVVLLRDTSRP